MQLLHNSGKPQGYLCFFRSLEDVVIFYIDPISFFLDKNEKFETDNYGRIMSSRSRMLTYVDLLSQVDVSDLVAFLSAL